MTPVFDALTIGALAQDALDQVGGVLVTLAPYAVGLAIGFWVYRRVVSFAKGRA